MGNFVMQFYNKHYAITPFRHSNLDYRLKLVESIFKKEKPQRILDIGCGDGNFTIYLKKVSKAKEAVGLDISPKAKKQNNRILTKIILNISDEKIPYSDSYFDAVFCGEIIEHLFNPDNLMFEIKRVLKKNGFCILTTPNLASWVNRISLMLGFQPGFTEISTLYNPGKILNKKHELSGHIRVFTHRALKKYLNIYGFKAIKFIPCIASKLTQPFKVIDILLSRFVSMNIPLVVYFQK